MRRLAILVLASTVALSACGTAVYNHRIEITVHDPSGRLGPPPISVSAFDRLMGSSNDWAQKWMRDTSPNSPYIGEVSATATKMFYDRSPADRVDAGIALPAYEKEGFFVLDIAPIEGSEQTTTLMFVAYGSPASTPVVPLPAKVRSESSDKGWLIHLRIDVPPAPAKP